MKIKRIFLDNYELCKKEESDLIIIPQSNEEGINAPELYYKRKNPYWLLTDISNDVVWSSDIKISTAINQDIYNKCIDWWFNNMSEEYQQQLLSLADSAISVGFDLSMSIEKAKNKLKLVDKQHRKSNLNKFLSDWISIGCSRFVTKQRSNGVYS